MGAIYGLTDPRHNAEVRYIGKTERTWNLRFNDHVHAARRGETWPVCRWIRCLLDAGLTPGIVLFEEAVNNLDELNALEIAYIEEFRERNGSRMLNVTDGGEGTGGGVRSEETRRRMSDAKRGELNPMYGRSGEDSPTWGREHTAETKQLISTKAKARDMSGERNPFYGRTHTKKTRKKLAAQWTAERRQQHQIRMQQEDVRQKQSKAWTPERKRDHARIIRSKNTERDTKIVMRYMNGATYAELGNEFGMTRSGARFVVLRNTLAFERRGA